MSWTQTHRRSAALTDIESALAVSPMTPPEWRDGYDELFGDRAGLVAFLRSRWSLRLADVAVDDRHREHPARTVARMGLAALDLQEVRRAVA